MSSRPAAPSRASATAWARTSESEWPMRPLSKGISTPPRMSSRPAPAKAWASTPRPTRKVIPGPGSPHPPTTAPALVVVGAFARDQYGLREYEVLRGGQLDVGLLPRDHPDRVAGVLGEEGVIRRGSQDLLGGGVDPAQHAEPEGLRGLGGVEPGPVEGLRDGAVLRHLDGVRDGEGGDHAVGPVAHRLDDAPYELGRDEATRAVVDQDDRLLFVLAEEQPAAGRERPGLAGLGATGVLADARLLGELLDALPVADDVDLVYGRGVLEGPQGVVEGRVAEQVYKLLRAAHPAAYTPGEHERDRRAGSGARYLEPSPSPRAPSTSASASSVARFLPRATSETRMRRAFASRLRSPVESPCS